jgi:hypothetical protein
MREAFGSERFTLVNNGHLRLGINHAVGTPGAVQGIVFGGPGQGAFFLTSQGVSFIG